VKYNTNCDKPQHLCHIPHVPIGEPPDRPLKHIHKPVILVPVARVVAEHALVNVPLKILRADEVVNAEDGTLQLAPKPLNRIRVGITPCELPCPMVYHRVAVLALPKRVVANELVCEYAAFGLDELADNRCKRVPLGVLRLEGNHVAAPFDHAEHWGLGLQ